VTAPEEEARTKVYIWSRISLGNTSRKGRVMVVVDLNKDRHFGPAVVEVQKVIFVQASKSTLRETFTTRVGRD
jgi:hypothetical protein